MKRIAHLLLPVLGGLLVISCGGGDDGNINCSAYVDRQYECEVLPPETKDQLRDQNVKICENWDAHYKKDVMVALDACTDVACDDMQACIQAANQMCQADVSAEIDLMCEKAVECQVENMTTMEECRTTMQSALGMLMCLSPEHLAGYVSCYQGVHCANFEDEWLACYVEWVGI